MDETTKELICRVVDGLASAAEQEELRAMAEHSDEVATELAEQREAAWAFRSLGLEEPSDEIRARFWGGVYNRLEQRTGWILVVAGLVLVLGFALYELFTDPGVHVLWRVGFAAMIVGLALLFSGVARCSCRRRSVDRYREVRR